MPKFGWTVLRVHDPGKARKFYETLGLTLYEERHGNDQIRYGTDARPVLELCPLQAGHSATAGHFAIIYRGEERITQVCAKLKQDGHSVVRQPRLSAHGYSATVLDGFGNTVELIQADGIPFEELADCLYNTFMS